MELSGKGTARWGDRLLVSRPPTRLGPAPYLANPSRHVSLLLHDTDNPRVLEHVFWSGTRGSIDGEAEAEAAFRQENINSSILTST
jgi:hypothetical protein